MKSAIRLFACAAIAGAMAQAASADVTIEMKHKETTQLLYVGEHSLSFDSPEGGKVIFRGDKDVLWVVDAKNKSYQEITKADLQKMGEQMTAAKSQMEEAMKNMPPEQQEMVKKMMAGRLPSAVAKEEEEVTVKPLGAEKEINGFKTEGYEVYHDDALQEETWTASPKILGLSADDFAVFKELAAFMETGIPGMKDLMGRFAKDFDKPEEDEVPGFPVLTIGKDPDGNETWRQELVRLEKGKIDPARFELPEGMEKQSIGIE